MAVDYGLVEAATNRIMEINGLILLQNQLISPDYVNQLGTMINAQLGVKLTIPYVKAKNSLIGSITSPFLRATVDCLNRADQNYAQF